MTEHRMIVADDIAVDKISFQRNGKPWNVPATPCVVIPDEHGGWRVCWEGGSAGSFETAAFAQAVARHMRGETAAP